MPHSPGAAGLRAAVVMLAAGDGRRVGHETNKVLLPLAGRRVFTWAIRWAAALPEVTRQVLVIREQDRGVVQRTIDREVADPGSVAMVTGGASRHGSEWQALQALAPVIDREEVDVVVIHDAARPLAATALFAEVIRAAARHGGAIPVLDQRQLTALTEQDQPPTRRVVAVQTPQAFAAAPLLRAYQQAADEGFVGTDTASCIERYARLPVHCVPGDARNIKITFPEDLFLAERLLARAGWDLSRPAPPAGAPLGEPRRVGLLDRWVRGGRP